MLYVLLVRPRLLTWGATGDESRRAYRGDALVPDPDGGATMATTLPAPPGSVCPWLAQMGGDPRRLVPLGLAGQQRKPSADHIVPDWQSLEEGQHLYRVTAPRRQHAGGDEPKGPNWWTVAIVEPNRTLVLQTS